MLKSQMFEDEFITSLDIFDRYLWVGLILVCDDQGRILDNSALIRSKIFPMDDISLEKINDCITRFHESGKIERYTTNEKPVIQIINWWKHQKPQWAGKSLFESPPGWVDRERYQISLEDKDGNRKSEIKVENWDQPGGYVDPCIDPYIDTKKETYIDGYIGGLDQSRDRDRNQVKGLVKGEGEDQEAHSEAETEKQNVSETKTELKNPSPSSSPSSSLKKTNGSSIYQILFNEIDRLTHDQLTQEEIIEVTKQIIRLPAKIEHVHSAINDLKDNNKKITKNSLLGFVKGAWQHDYQMGRES